ncbi:MAG: hypothetical protein FWH21_01145 [Kiritimatiellaeota bacterium]|nr:hypothetical protein [Kiritimatiellota bacterium]
MKQMRIAATVLLTAAIGLWAAAPSRADLITAIGLISDGLANAVLAAERANASLDRAGQHARDIYIGIIAANTEREPLGLDSVWPKSGKKKEGHGDIPEMLFENSSDYFTVLLDGENMHTENWSSYILYGDTEERCWMRLAGGGIPPKVGAGRLTAANNIWIIAANVTDDMEDLIPVIISRNVDPASLIPQEGDQKAQRIRPSREFTAPFGDKEFVLVMKGGGIFKGTFSESDNLYTLYQGEDLRTTFQKVKYLTP